MSTDNTDTTFDGASPPPYTDDDINLNYEAPPPAYTAVDGQSTDVILPATTTATIAVATPPPRIRRVLAGIRTMVRRAWRIIVPAPLYDENYPMARRG